MRTPTNRYLRGLGQPPAPPGPPTPAYPYPSDMMGPASPGIGARRDFFTYQSTALALAPSGVATDIINIEADSNFILEMLSYFADGNSLPDLTDFAATNTSPIALTAGYRVLPKVSVIITDSGSGRQMMQEAVPIPALFGTGAEPYVLPHPRLLLRNTSVQIQYTSLDATNTYNIFLEFIGYKVYGSV